MDAARHPDQAARPARAGARRVPNLGLLASLVAARKARMTLSIALGDEPPTEFCIFTAGKVETTKGVFVFDNASALSVMTEYKAHGIDLMIDYDHASLAAFALDPALAGKAAGWFNLEVRDGALWAVNVRWTPPAADALRRKEWRFMSPAFDVKEGHITSLLNVAITNIPATRRLTPLMAASVTALGEGMDPKLISSALDALIAGDETKCAEILKGLVASAAGGDADAATEDAPPPAGDGGADEAVEVPMAAAEAPTDKPEEVAAALSRVMRLSGKKSFVESLAAIETWHASHVELETERGKLATERATLESAERRKGCVELVTLYGRAPATVWADDKATSPKKYLAAMSIADFREYVADAKASAGKRPAAPTPPAAGATHDLTPREIALCAEKKIDPAVYAATRAGITARNVKKGG